MNITFTTKAAHFGFITRILRDNIGFYPLYKRISNAANGVRPNDDDLLSISLSEDEIINCLLTISRYRYGVASKYAIELKEVLIQHITDGLKINPNEEPVLDGQGNQVISPMTGLPTTTLNVWQRLAQSLQNTADQEANEMAAMVNDGWNFLLIE